MCNDDSDENFDCIYEITVRVEDWVNPTINGRISWERESSCTSDLDEEIERWQNQLHKVTMLNCNMMARSLHYVTKKARELTKYDGLIIVDAFLNKFESTVLEQQLFDALKWVLHAMLARWSGMHQVRF